MKKRRLTLIEVMIALGIASLLLGVLFPYFTQTLRLKKQMEREKTFVFSKAHVQQRLSSLFSQISNSQAFKTEEAEGKPTKLTFQFNNGYAQDENFRGNVKGSLYAQDQKLLLVIEGKDKHSFQEVLFEGIQSASFEFSYQEKGMFLTTRDQWKKNALPLFFVLNVKFSSEKEEAFYFRLTSNTPFQYPSRT